MMGQAGATGAPGSHRHRAAASGAVGRLCRQLIARIKPNIVFTDNRQRQPGRRRRSARLARRHHPRRRLVKSSGNEDWDDAVLRAIDRTGDLPRDTDGRVPPVLVISFTP